MDFSNEGQSVYHDFLGFVLNNGDDQPLHFAGPRHQWLEDNWSLFQPGNTETFQGTKPRVYHDPTVKLTTVVVLNEPRATRDAAFETFFLRRILDQVDLCADAQASPTAESDSAAERVVDLFDTYLRYQGKDDKWQGLDGGGRSYFIERVRHFTSRSAPVQFCLPAFPCKSSNGNKVVGTNPDRGEELALERLHGFVAAIETIYRHGAKLWIISDGHVFSDCIGVDDLHVDSYGEKLNNLNYTIGLRRGSTTRVAFKSLVDFLQPAAVETNETLPANFAGFILPSIDSYLDTKSTTEADFCRRVLMAGCRPQTSAVRAKIKSRDAAITALYRGFSRFMLEDLEGHRYCRSLTKSQRKKLSARVAFEMILV
jgi:pyoverdine/dityrosine biosynthesis protein Dit1